MIVTQTLCNNCQDIISEFSNRLAEKVIVIKGRIHYCNETCMKENQKRCGEETCHKNSVKVGLEGECLDCGISYAEPEL